MQRKYKIYKVVDGKFTGSPWYLMGTISEVNQVLIHLMYGTGRYELKTNSILGAKAI